MRLFIAISFEEDIVEQIAEVQRRLCEALETGVPVPAENMHLTLVFLGEIDEDDLVAVEDVLDDVQSRLNFDLVFDRVDTFGSHGKSPESTTWWLGAQPSKQLDHLQKETSPKWPGSAWSSSAARSFRMSRSCAMPRRVPGGTRNRRCRSLRRSSRHIPSRRA